MPDLKEKKVSQKEVNFEKEYKKLFDKGEYSYSNVEWTKKGDSFKKLSMFKNYSPVKTSSHSTLVGQL